MRADRASGPLGRLEIEAMSAAVSASTGASFGVKRACGAWGVRPSTPHPLRAAPARRGPATAVLGEELYAMIADDLEGSPFCGEGHRKVRARVRVAGVRVSRRRVLRSKGRRVRKIRVQRSGCGTVRCVTECRGWRAHRNRETGPYAGL
jgi:hypothetical protein